MLADIEQDTATEILPGPLSILAKERKGRGKKGV